MARHAVSQTLGALLMQTPESLSALYDSLKSEIAALEAALASRKLRRDREKL